MEEPMNHIKSNILILLKDVIKMLLLFKLWNLGNSYSNKL